MLYGGWQRGEQMFLEIFMIVATAERELLITPCCTALLGWT